MHKLLLCLGLLVAGLGCCWGQDKYSVVTSIDEVVEGAEYVFVNIPFKSGSVQYGLYSMGQQGTNALKFDGTTATSLPTEIEASSLPAETATITVEKTGTQYILKCGEKYMNVGTSNGLNLKDAKSDATLLDLEMVSSTHQVKFSHASGSDTFILQMFAQNKNNAPSGETFKFYKTTQKAVVLFKKQIPNKTPVTLAWEPNCWPENVRVGDEFELKTEATIDDEGGFLGNNEYSVTLVSSNPEIVSVAKNDDGKWFATAHTTGETTITATFDENTLWECAEPITYDLTVEAPLKVQMPKAFVNGEELSDDATFYTEDAFTLECTTPGAKIYYSLVCDNEDFEDVYDAEYTFDLLFPITGVYLLTAYAKMEDDSLEQSDELSLIFNVTEAPAIVTYEATYDFVNNHYGMTPHTDGTYDTEGSVFKEGPVTLTTVGKTRFYDSSGNVDFRVGTGNNGFTLSVPEGCYITGLKFEKGNSSDVKEWKITNMDVTNAEAEDADEDGTWTGSANKVKVLNKKTSVNTLYSLDVTFVGPEVGMPEFDEMKEDSSKVSFVSNHGDLHVFVIEYDENDLPVGDPREKAISHEDTSSQWWTNKVQDAGDVHYIDIPQTEGHYIVANAKTVANELHSAPLQVSIDNKGNIQTGVKGIQTEGDSAERFYNLQGVEIQNPSKGLYICVKGGKAKKIIL